jgi:hypothetical protein
MLKQFRVHVGAHLKFYLRNRLVLGLLAASLLMWGMGLLGSWAFESAGGRFDRLKHLSSQMHGLVWFYGALLALLAMWSHLRERSTRLVFTRPAAPEVWLASIFGAALLVAVAAHAFTAVLTFVLSLAWGVPYQIGFAWRALDSMLESVVAIALMAALGVGVHPVIAGFAMFLFSDEFMYYLYVLFASTEVAGGATAWMSIGKWTTRSVYTVMPMLDPFADKTAPVASSMRVSAADWGYLAATAAYAGLISTFSFFLGSFTLRRRTL